MLSIDECKKILNKKEQKYTTEQIKEIRLTLYKLADIVYTEKNNQNEQLNRKESNSLQKS
jgi:hypothetical protein